MIYLLTAIGLTLVGSSTVHIYSPKYTEQQNETEYTEENIYIISRIKRLGISWHVVKDFTINGFKEMAYRDLT